MTERRETGEHELSTRSAIVFVNEDAVNEARRKLRVYDEAESKYKPMSAMAQRFNEGESRLVGIFKATIMTFAINHADTHGYQVPISLADVLDKCRDKTKFPIAGAESIKYILNPHIDKDDKERLQYCPDFSAMLAIEHAGTYAEVRAFYESLYTIQKVAQGIRDDLIGGSEFVGPPITWEDVKEGIRSAQEEMGNAALRDM